MMPLSISKSVDIVVIGGGIIGMACADALSRERLSVVVVERLGLASGASAACQGGVGLEPFMNDFDLQMHLAGIREYQHLTDDGLDVGYRRDGGLIAADPEEEATLKPRLEHLRSLGIGCEWINQKDLLGFEPNLSPSIGGAILFDDYSQIYPIKVVVELARRAKKSGAQIYTNTELIGIEITNGKVTAALTSNGRIVTGMILIAAGAWSSKIGQLAGLKIPVWPLKGHVLVTEPMPGMLRHFITETGYETGADIMRKVEINAYGPQDVPPQVATALQNLPRGDILIGSSREFKGFNREVNHDRIKEIARRACRLVPGLANTRIIRTYTGFRPWTPDGHPLVGPTKQADGIVIAAGHSGEGNTLALLTGRLIADLLIGRLTPIDPEPLSPDRFVMC